MPGIEELLAGRTLVKRYRIEQVIGRGGFAAVYRALDERLGRPVAVKVITYPAPDEALLEELRARFQREARAAASLPQHPNVVTVHDFGIDPELGLDFLVMEFLHGEDLASRLAREGRPPLAEGLAVLRTAAEGVAVGHRAGLVHRDVKPGNIFLAHPHDDGPPRVCVLDFGIARVLEDEEHLTRLTRGSVPHSPAYASPEQLRGEVDLAPASDVFSLGVVGYQLLGGEKPFGAERRGDRVEDSRPARELRALNPEVPAEVEAVIARAMSVQPEERFADAEAFAAALDAATGAGAGTTAVYAPAAAAAAPPPPEDRTLLAPEPEPAPPPPAPRAPAARPAPAAPPARRGGRGWLIALLLLVLVGAGALFALSGGDDGGDEPAAVGAPAVEPVAGTDEGEVTVADDAEPEVEPLPAAEPVTGATAAGAGAPTPQAEAPPAGAADPAAAPSPALPPAQRPASGQQAPARPAPQPADPSPPAPADTARPRPPVLLGRPVQPRPVTPPDTARPDTVLPAGRQRSTARLLNHAPGKRRTNVAGPAPAAPRISP